VKREYLKFRAAPEPSIFPASRTTPWPLSSDELPRDYWAMMDPMVALAMAAGVTTRFLLGTAICLVIQRDHPRHCGQGDRTRRFSVGRPLHLWSWPRMPKKLGTAVYHFPIDWKLHAKRSPRSSVWSQRRIRFTSAWTIS